MKIDNRFLARLKLPHAKADHIVFDGDLPGFGLRLRGRSNEVRRNFIVQYRANGRTRRMLIGSADVLSAEQARAAAKKILVSGFGGTVDRQGRPAEVQAI